MIDLSCAKSLMLFRALVIAIWALSLHLLVQPNGAYCQTADETAAERIEITGTTMGPIPYQALIIRDQTTPSQEVLASAVSEVLEQVNRLMSTYKPDSDVTRFNQSKSTEWFDVHPDTAAVVLRSLEISEQEVSP